MTVAAALRPTELAARDNIAALQQGRALLKGLPPEIYRRRAAECFNSSIGGHMRHVLDHYSSLLEGLGSGQVDYEARTRDARIEADPAFAIDILDGLCGHMEGLSQNAQLAVRSECCGEQAPVWAETSLLRELEFSLSHTVHHYALIAVMAGLAGMPVPGNFGMAPSTLRHLAASPGGPT